MCCRLQENAGRIGGYLFINRQRANRENPKEYLSRLQQRRSRLYDLTRTPAHDAAILGRIIKLRGRGCGKRMDAPPADKMADSGVSEIFGAQSEKRCSHANTIRGERRQPLVWQRDQVLLCVVLDFEYLN